MMMNAIERLRDVRAVVFDWAGTMVDYGSRAPALAFVESFRRQGIDITIEEARGPMGMSKRDHIEAITALPRIRHLWNLIHGRLPNESDIQGMYETFIPMQKELLQTHSDVIPGVVDVVRQLRESGYKIGSSTGYTRELMEVVLPIAAKAGYAPDVVVCADDVRAGRPAPWLNFTVAQQLDVYPMQSILIVDDTPIGIAAGVNAGTLTVAVSRTGNSLGLSQKEADALPPAELESRLARITEEFRQAGADFVVESAADVATLLASS